MPRLDRTFSAFFLAALAPAFLAGACATAATPSISDTSGGDTGGTKGDGGTSATGGGTYTYSGGTQGTGGSTSASGGMATGGSMVSFGGSATGGTTSPTGGIGVTASGGRATGGTTSPTGGVAALSGGTTSVSTGGTAVTASGGTAVTASGGTAVTATGGAATGTGGGPSNSVPLTTGGYYQMSTTYGGYCFTSADNKAGGSTISPPCGTGACFTPSTGLCVSGTVGAVDTGYTIWGVLVGCNIAQPTGAGTGNPPTTTLSPTLSVHVTLSANAGTTLPTSLRVQVGDGSGTNDTTYCGTLTLTGGSGTVALSSLKSYCWDTSGTAFTATTKVANVQIEAVSTSTAQPYNFCISALSIS